MMAAHLLGLKDATFGIGVVIAIGGILSARKVAQTMSQRITAINHVQGFTANLVSAILVILASIFSFPVSTTHVTCGSIFGIGLVNGKANGTVVGNILFSWIATLPLAGILSSVIFHLMK